MLDNSQNLQAAIIPDHLLRHFAKPNPLWDRGEVTDEDIASIVTALPDIAAELLQFRQAERLGRSVPAARAPWFAKLLPSISDQQT